MHVSLGFIGAGWAARHRHLAALSSMPQVKLSRIWSRDPAKARQLAQEFGFEGAVDRWEDVVTSSAVDAVVISTPPVLHCPATLAALGAGKHVLCQARMARNLQESQAMAKAASESSLVTALYPALPGLKGDKVMKRLLHQEKFVGDIREVRVAGIAVATPSEGYHWLSNPSVAGINAMTVGMWAEVAHRWVGEAEELVAVDHVSPEPQASPESGHAGPPMPDSLAIAARLRCGAVASYHFSAGAGSVARNTMEIFGSEGTLSYEFFKEEIRGARVAEEPTLIDIPAAEQGVQDTDRKFIEAILGGDRTVAPTFEEGLRYMEFTEAAAISAFTGARVSLPPTPTMECWGKPLNDEAVAPASARPSSLW